MAVNTSSTNMPTTEQRAIAFFPKKEDAYRAITELRNAGFTTDEIGLITRGQDKTAISSSRTTAGSGESLREKLKHFFSGDNSEDFEYRDSVQGMNWDENRAQYYYHGIGEGGAVVSVAGSRIDQARRILRENGGDLRESGFDTTSAKGSTAEPPQDYRIQLRGEVLRTYRDRVQRGEVRLRKEVVTENQTVEVPVTREELVIERVPGSQTQGQTTGEIGSDKEIRVPLSEERARVEKQPVVNEEVRVGKRAVQNTQRVSDNVRHEELRVDKDGDVDVNGQIPRKDKKPAA